jgi:hypothetical protein
MKALIVRALRFMGARPVATAVPVGMPAPPAVEPAPQI